MAADINDGTLRAALDKVDPNSLADLLGKLGFGSLLQSQIVQTRRRVNIHATVAGATGVDPYNLATLDCLKLPNNAKAATILRATDRVGGELTIDAFGTTPITGHIAVSPTGDIVTLASDAYADLDIVYVPERLEVREFQLPVASNAATLPTSVTAKPRGVVLLLEAEAVKGTTTGKCKVLVPSASAATTGTARMSLDKATVKFYATDAVTWCRVKVGIVPTEDVASLLESALTW